MLMSLILVTPWTKWMNSEAIDNYLVKTLRNRLSMIVVFDSYMVSNQPFLLFFIEIGFSSK